MHKILILVLGLFITSACNAQIENRSQMDSNKSSEAGYNVNKSEKEWENILTPEQYYVLRQKGTERPNTGQYNLHFEDGVYKCAACNAPLFDSEAKFESHCGWPSFDKALSKNTVIEKLDTSHGMVRTEILCANCGSHLGHVFDDGPTETGMRYCINSVALDFNKENKNSSGKKTESEK